MDSRRGEARIIDAAEALFAERGLDGVTTREILDAAGQKNQSALQYHFGSREGLILALLKDRFARIDKRRMALFSAQAKRPGQQALRSLVEAIVLPLAEEVRTRQGGEAFVRVLAQLVHRPGFDTLEITSASKFEGLRRINSETDKQLAHLPRGERLLRARMMLSLMVGTLSSWTQYHKRNVPFDAMLSGLIEALVSLAASAPAQSNSNSTIKKA